MHGEGALRNHTDLHSVTQTQGVRGRTLYIPPLRRLLALTPLPLPLFEHHDALGLLRDCGRRLLLPPPLLAAPDQIRGSTASPATPLASGGAATGRRPPTADDELAVRAAVAGRRTAQRLPTALALPASASAPWPASCRARRQLGTRRCCVHMHPGHGVSLWQASRAHVLLHPREGPVKYHGTCTWYRASCGRALVHDRQHEDMQ